MSLSSIFADVAFASGSFVLGYLSRHWIQRLPWFSSDRSDAPGPSASKIRYMVEYRTAVHELGHLACAWVSPGAASITLVSIDYKSTGHGVVSTRHVDPLSHPSYAWDFVALCVAGLVAEVVCLKRARSMGSKEDLQHARSAADYLVESGAEPPSTWQVPEVLPEAAFDVSTCMQGLPQAQARVLRVAVWRARDIIARYKGEIGETLPVLLEEGTITMDHLEPIWGPRPTLI